MFEPQNIFSQPLDPTQSVVSIIIPTINEEEGIGPTLSELPLSSLKDMGVGYEVIIVDGGSKDKTIEKAEQFGASIINEPRKGYGRAYRTAFEKCKGDILVTLDGDNTYPTFMLPKLVETLVKENLDFITTNRMARLRPGAMNPIHKLGNLVLSFFARILFSVKIIDSQSGMWVFRKDVLKQIVPKCNGMSFSQEIKIRAFRSCRSTEIPIEYRKRVGNPKIQTLMDGLKNLKNLFHLKFEARQ